MRIFLVSLLLSAAMGPVSAFAGPVKILALGDSYTVGQGVTEQESWPVQLKERLKQSGSSVASVDIIAHTGWTSRDLLSAVKKSNLENNYDVVLILIGANDQFQGRPVSEYARDLNMLVGKAIVFTKNRPSHVILVSVPDWAFSPHAAGWDQKEISSQINAFNQAAKNLADAASLRWVNITDLSRQITDSPSFVNDGLHPTAETYAAWVDIILPLVQDITE